VPASNTGSSSMLRTAACHAKDQQIVILQLSNAMPRGVTPEGLQIQVMLNMAHQLLPRTSTASTAEPPCSMASKPALAAAATPARLRSHILSGIAHAPPGVNTRAV